MHPLNVRFIAHLEAGGTVLTATRRQARLIRGLFDRAQLAAGRRSWPTADILPLAAWAGERWHEAARRHETLPILLDENQAAWPWRTRAAGFIDAGLVDIQDLSAAARRAWVALLGHGGSLARLGGYAGTRDQRQFHDWAVRVERDLARHGWLDPGALDGELARHAGLLEPSAPLLLAGYGQLRPALRQLLARLAERGWDVEVAPVSGEAGDCRVLAAEVADTEVLAMAAWARARLATDPQARLAVVIADLQSRRGALERSFEAALQPDLELPGSLEHDRLFDFAGGPALATLGIGEAALDCLASAGGRVGHAAMSRLLRCRYVGDPGELEARARFDIDLRRAGVLEWRSAALASRAREGRCDSVALALESSSRVLGEGPPQRSPDVWAQAFGCVLSAWGWPGGVPLASDEHQAAEALRKRLVDFAGLSRSAPRLGLAAALAEFSRLVASPFQPERGEASITVFDALEPPGVGFDGLWVSGMTAAAWPRAAAPDPFLPLALQVELGMPAVTAEHTLEEARRVTAAWQGTAPEVIFSWPLQQDDATVEPSRILSGGLAALDASPAVSTRAERLFAGGGLQAVPDDPAPPLSGAARGGARVLELQAKCPFRAFAELRLVARPLEEPATGVDPRARGTVLHRAMELVWRVLRGRRGLDALSPEALEVLLDDSLAQALAEEAPDELGPRARELEREWQRAAMARLMELEQERGPFDVLATEAELQASFAGLQLTLRVDRVDRVAAGLVIIDYKTGAAATSQWRGARPDAPQLPLYAALKGDDVAGVAFATAGAHEARFRGVGAAPDLLPGLEAAERFKLTDDQQAGFSWEQVSGRWAGWLASLARAHLDGVATVDPKLPETCRYCHLHTLCRVATGPEADEAEDGDE